MSKSLDFFNKMTQRNYMATERTSSSAYVGCVGCTTSTSICLCESVRSFEGKIVKYHAELNLDSLVETGALKLDPRINGRRELRQK